MPSTAGRSRSGRSSSSIIWTDAASSPSWSRTPPTWARAGRGSGRALRRSRLRGHSRAARGAVRDQGHHARACARRPRLLCRGRQRSPTSIPGCATSASAKPTRGACARRMATTPRRLVRENPYRLADEIHGIGFLTADSLRVMLGIGADLTVPPARGTQVRARPGGPHRGPRVPAAGRAGRPHRAPARRAARARPVAGSRMPSCVEARARIRAGLHDSARTHAWSRAVGRPRRRTTRACTAASCTTTSAWPPSAWLSCSRIDAPAVQAR